jgi:pyrimidine-specific ribonucleoside hydrolase
VDREPSRPEYNLGGDPRAARAVFARIARPNLVIADLTYQAAMRVAPDSAICTALDAGARGTWQRVVGEQFRAWFALPKPSFQHDPLALSVALGKRFVTFGTARIALDEVGRMTLAAEGPEIWLARAVQYEPFMTWLYEGLGLSAAVGRGQPARERATHGSD